MISFPNNPVVGTQYTVGAKSWRWNGVAWDSLAIADTQVQRAESAATRAEAAATQIGTAAAFTDSNPIVKGSADATKQVRLEVDGLTSGQTRVLTVQDKSGTIATLDDVTDAGDVRLIASVVPTAAAAIDLTGVFSDTYERYMITFIDVSTTSSAPQMRLLTGENVVRTDSLYVGGTVVATPMAGVSNAFGTLSESGTGFSRFNGNFNVMRGAEFVMEGTSISRFSTPSISIQRYAYMFMGGDVTGFRLLLGSGTFNAGGRINVYAFSKT